MAIYKVLDTKTGRTVKFEWSGQEPPTDADMEEVFASARQAQPQVQPPVSPASMPEMQEPSAMKRFLIGMGSGLTRFGQGVKQLGMEASEYAGVAPFGGAEEYTRETQAERDWFAGTPVGKSKAGKIGQFVGETAPFMAIPVAGPTGLGARMGMGALTGAGIGALQFAGPEESRTQNVLMGGIFGGATPLALASAGKVVSGLRGKVASPKAAALMEKSREHGVPLAYPDIKGGAVAPKVGTTLEQVPLIGLGGFREKQHEAARSAARKFVGGYNAPGHGPSFLDWPQIAQEGIVAKEKGLAKAVGVLYDRTAQIADPMGNIPVRNTLAAIDDVLAKEVASKAPDKALIGLLENARQALKGKTIKTTSAILDKYGKPTETMTTKLDNTFSNLRDFRSSLGSMVSDYYKGMNALVGERGVGKLQAVKNAVERDISAWADAKGGNIKATYKAADHFYKTQVIPYRNEKILTRLATETDPDALYKIFMASTQGRPTTLYKALPESGRAAVRFGIMNDALQKSLREGGEKFSPTMFAGALDKMKSATGVFFTPSEAAEIEGFKNLMRAAFRAGQYAENPPTGQRVINALLFGGVSAAVPEALAAVPPVAFIRAMFTTQAGKNFLLASAKLAPDSPAMQKLMDTYAPRIAASAGVNLDVLLPMVLGEEEETGR